MQAFKAYAGRDLYVDSSVFMSERTTGHRNRALAHLMRHFEMMDDRIDETLDLYFQQCALLVDCRDLVLMAATLANNGINPRSGDRAIQSMFGICGMYNFAGEWAYRVGLLAKSGVSGGIIAVVLGKMGIAVFSPPLDIHGSTVRGVKVCEDLSNICKLHLFDRV